MHAFTNAYNLFVVRYVAMTTIQTACCSEEVMWLDIYKLWTYNKMCERAMLPKNDYIWEENSYRKRAKQGLKNNGENGFLGIRGHCETWLWSHYIWSI